MLRYPLYHTALLSAVLPLMVFGCKGETSTPEVEIIEVRVSPGEVQAGYISELVCVFSDSLSDRYQFKWTLENSDGQRIDTTTNTKTFFYKTPSITGTYSNSVQVLHKGKELTEAYPFEVTVVEKDWIPEDPFFEEANLMYYQADLGTFLMNTKTKESRHIIDGGLARWSPEGNRILFNSGNPNANNFLIYLVNPDGSNKRVVSLIKTNSGNIVETFGNTSYLVWSPDGIRFAYADCVNCDLGNGNKEIYIGTTDFENWVERVNITNNEYSDTPVDWHPNGDVLMIQSKLKPPGIVGHFRDIYTIYSDGTNKELFKEHEELNICSPRYSPNGEKIVFTCGEDTELYVADSDGNNIKQITRNNLRESYASWLPDGSGIVFVMDPGHIYTIDIDGTNLTQITEGIGTYRFPEWRPNRN